tara:strand:- start:16151 stop:17758 length:1608 start_codon:yes stop_codon:yes gene_type:complete
MRHGLQYAAFVALGLMLTTPALAVSVGEIRPQSRVGEPLAVQIAIIDSEGFTDDSILVTPATAADHALLGMQRPIWLDQMVFTTVRDAKGQLQVRGKASALAPNSEQNFLVQLSWPGHVRLQQVSVSLPAAGSALPANDSVAESAGPAALPTTEATVVIPVRPRAVEKSTAVPVVESPVQARSGQLLVRHGDTLSQIASEWDQDLSLNQRQKIIRERNPQAFISGNINLIRAGASLSLPDTKTIEIPTERAANRWYQKALKQAEGLLEPTLKKPVVAAAGAENGEASADANLTLVSPGKDSGGASGAAENSGSDAAASALADAETERTSLLDKRLQLSNRLAALNEENADADKRLQVLDERLAAMERGEPVADDAADAVSDESSEHDNNWLWWLAAGIFWLLLFVVLLRQRAQNKEAASAAESAPESSKEDAVEAATEDRTEPTFDDTFTNLTAGSSSLGSYDDEPAGDDDAEDEGEYDFLNDSESEAFQTRLDLAQAYLDMNEVDAARQLLDRVVEGGTSEQRARAKALIDELG